RPIASALAMTRLITLAACAAALALSSPAFGQSSGATGNAEVGSQKVQMCQGCHGIPGWRTAYPEVYRVPKIAGQHQAYLVKALQEYKSGARTHPSMRAIASSLSDADMANVAAYYAQSELRVAQ